MDTRQAAPDVSVKAPAAPSVSVKKSAAPSVSVKKSAELRGQVSFEDWRPVFQMLAESSGLERLKLEAIEPQTSYRHGQGTDNQLPMAGTDGCTIYLPTTMALFPDHADNFGFYKVALFHQLGYFEFGCFDSLHQLVAKLHGFGNPPVAERLFAILEDSRIDWQLECRYPGLRQQLAVQKAQAAGLAVTAGSRRFRLLCYITSVGLDAPEPAWLKPEESEAAAMIDAAMARLREPDASLEDSIQALMHLYPLVSENEDTAPMPAAELTGV